MVRGNIIAHCKHAGIVGGLGGAFSRIGSNRIRPIHVRCPFGEAEMSGIKLHGAIDTGIRRNHFHDYSRGLGVDWMAQGTRLTQNLFRDHAPSEDVSVDADPEPFLVATNVFLSPTKVRDIPEGGA